MAAAGASFAARVGFLARFRKYKKYDRMPDYIPPVIDDLRRDEHGKCLPDEMPCWDGSFVRRNEDLDCNFDKCTARKVRSSGLWHKTWS